MDIKAHYKNMTHNQIGVYIVYRQARVLAMGGQSRVLVGVRACACRGRVSRVPCPCVCVCVGGGLFFFGTDTRPFRECRPRHDHDPVTDSGHVRQMTTYPYPTDRLTGSRSCYAIEIKINLPPRLSYRTV